MERLRQRADYLAAATGAKAPVAGFVMQARRREDEGAPRVGFTVSKKVGNAVERNRVRRRFKELVRLTAEGRVRAGHDYVIVGRRGALTIPFGRMVEEFATALGRVHAGRKRRDQAASRAPAAATTTAKA